MLINVFSLLFIFPTREIELTCYCTSNIKKEGHDVIIIIQGSRNINEIVEMVLNKKPNIVGISCLTYNTPISQQIARKIKSKDNKIFIVCSGEHPSISPDTTFTEDIDLIVKGEGEITLLKIINEIEQGKIPYYTKGIYYRKNGKIIYTGDRTLAEINSLAWPLREEKVIKATKMGSIFYPIPEKQTGLATLLASRGCSFNCSYYSSHSLWGNKTRFRNISDINKEIEFIIEHFGVNVIVFL